MPLRFFFNDTATTEIYTLSLHDALPISLGLAHASLPTGSRASPQAWCWLREGAGGPHLLKAGGREGRAGPDRKSTRLNSSHANISYAVFCLKKKKKNKNKTHNRRMT